MISYDEEVWFNSVTSRPSHGSREVLLEYVNLT